MLSSQLNHTEPASTTKTLTAAATSPRHVFIEFADDDGAEDRRRGEVLDIVLNLGPAHDLPLTPGMIVNWIRPVGRRRNIGRSRFAGLAGTSVLTRGRVVKVGPKQVAIRVGGIVRHVPRNRIELIAPTVEGAGV